MEPLQTVAFRDMTYPASKDSDRSESAGENYKFKGKRWKPAPVPTKLRHSRNFIKGENKTVMPLQIADNPKEASLDRSKERKRLQLIV